MSHAIHVQYSNLAKIPTATASYAKTKTPTPTASATATTQRTHADARSQLGYTTSQPAEIHEWHETAVLAHVTIYHSACIPMKAQPQTAPPSACAGTGRDISLDRVEIRYFLRCVI